MKAIPITAAKRIAKTYGYDQVIVIARKVSAAGETGGEHCTTYGVNAANCHAAAQIGDFLKYRIMKWPPSNAEKRRELLDKIAELAAELCTAVAYTEEDIGGTRHASTVLTELCARTNELEKLRKPA